MLEKEKIETILKRLASDDQSAVDELFHYYYSRLYHFSQRLLKSESGIDDVIQDIFFKIWINRKKINNPETFNAYIFTITKNAVINIIRSNLRNQAFKNELLLKSVAEEHITENQYEFDEVKKAIDNIVAKLPEKRQHVFLLSRSEGLTNKEIALKLGISEKTVEDHITQAIKFIKKSLKEMGILALLYFYLFF